MSSYSGGHTKIFVSEEGTIWPEDPLNPREKPERRWSIAGSAHDSDEPKPLNKIKIARYRYLADLARAYRTKQSVEALPRPPQELWPVIRAAGGIIEWINNDTKALETFWYMVDQQQSGKWDQPVKNKGKRRRR